MNKEVIQQFSRGMIKDIGKLSQPKDSYLDARNLRLITLSGQSNYTIENVKGNNLSFTIPNVTGLYQLISIGPLILSFNSRVIINGITVNLGNIQNEFQGLADMLNNPIAAYFSSTANLNSYIALGIKAALAEDENSVYITSVNGSTITSLSALGSALTTPVVVLSGDSNLIPIGFTTIRDDIFIFTTNNTSSTGGNGQIFKLTYSKITYIATLELIYYGPLNFTTQHPIPPSAIEGRFETSEIQRIYWSDNFNPPRVINVEDPNLLALDVSQVDSQPEEDLSIPILQKIGYNGALLVGVYQAAYRLKKTGGATGNFSQLSNQVYIVNDVNDSTVVGGALFKDYISDVQGIVSNKTITWKITNLDTDFNTVELAVVFRDSLNGTPIVSIVKEEPIDSTGSILLTYTGNEENITPIPLSDLTATSIYIDRVKSLGTKDNRLFYANISTASKSLDTFDTRAYRFNNGGNANITDKGATTSYSSAFLLASNNALPETNDSIAGDQSTFRYKANGTTLGGQGYNVSYEFGVYVIAGDTTVDLTATQTAPYRVNYSPIAAKVNLGISGQDYPLNQFNDYMGSPYLASIFKSCKRGEIYRWGLQFFDKAGSPLFVKWIGDIAMPAMFDTISAANRLNEDGTQNADAVTDFRISYTDSFGVCKVQVPFIKFNVSNLDDIADQIGGYSFVRVERKEEDKTILGQGIMHMTQRFNATNLYMPRLATYSNLNVNTAVAADVQLDTATLQIPEFLFNGFPGFQSGDFVRIIGYSQLANSIQDISPDATNPATYTIEKLYDLNNYTLRLDLDEAIEVGFAQSITVNSYGTYHNFDEGPLSFGLSVNSDAVGSKTLYIKADANIPFTALRAIDPEAKFIVEYKRALADQYGGNSYSDRTSNTYISAGHFQPTDDNSTSFTTNVLGGDTFNNIFDNQRAIKNWSLAISGRTPSGSAATGAVQSLTDYFPVETSVGTEWRSGIHINRNLLADAASDPEDNAYLETFDYNNVLDSESNLRFYNPRPLNFQDVTEFDNRVYASQIKINGEGGDSWTIFQENDYWDVEGSYGPINAMSILRDKMLFWQDTAFGILSINPRSLITDSSGVELQLGVGEIIQRHDYISTIVGCRHQWGITKSSNSAYWFDINNKKFYKFDGNLNQLSDTKGMASYFYNNLNGFINTTDNPIYNDPTNGINGITCVYDFRFNEAIFTFLDKNTKFTLAYNEQVDSFTAFYDYTPGLYITDNQQIFSPDPANLNKIYLHENGDYCKFYGTIFDSTLSIITNEDATKTKAFDNIVIGSESLNGVVNINDDVWKEIRIYNDYQNTDYQTLNPTLNIKRKERSWQLQVPRNRVKYTSSDSPNIFTDLNVGRKQFGERIKDKYITTDLIYDNSNNYNLKTHFFKVIYRVSDR